MTSMELTPYTPTHRDQVEKDLYEKPEIHAECRHGMDIVVYFLRKTGLVSMALTENNTTREFTIPNDAVADALEHPYLYMYRAGLEIPVPAPAFEDCDDGA